MELKKNVIDNNIVEYVDVWCTEKKVEFGSCEKTLHKLVCIVRAVIHV